MDKIPSTEIRKHWKSSYVERPNITLGLSRCNADVVYFSFHHFHIDHIASCLLSKFFITIVFNFSSVSHSSQYNGYAKFFFFFWGGGKQGTLWSMWKQWIHQRLFLKVFYFFVSDGQRILSCGADHFMRVLDVHTGTEVYCKDVGEEIRWSQSAFFKNTIVLSVLPPKFFIWFLLGLTVLG